MLTCSFAPWWSSVRHAFRCLGAWHRVWFAGQRLHHGLTGALLASVGIGGLAARRLTPRGGVECALLGTVLMAHDWNDRTVWFRVGPQE